MAGQPGATTSESVVLDACVLYPAVLRDTLLRIAEAGLYLPLWSETILEEVARNLVENGVTTRERADRLVGAMRSAFPDATVAGFEHLIPLMTNHPKDRHVLAAAVQASAPLILTFNRRDFPQASLTPHGVSIQSPDQFLVDWLERHQSTVLRCLERQAAALTRPPMSLYEMLDLLRRTAPAFTSRVRQLRPQQSAGEQAPDAPNPVQTRQRESP